MSREESKLQLFLYGIIVLASLIILIDFVWPAKVFEEEVLNVERKTQSHYNASGNYHYSYKAITPTHQFSISQDLAKAVKDKKIKYSVSRIFKQINKYGLPSSEKSAVHSFRIASGLVLPLVAVVSILVAFVFRINIDTLKFILVPLLIADLVYLII